MPWKRYYLLVLLFLLPEHVIAMTNKAEEHSMPLTQSDIREAERVWGEAIVDIGNVYSANGDYRARAAEHIAKLYAYGSKPVLFKPTLAAEYQFRGTSEDALSYFVGGKYAEDKGFALAPYSKVRFMPAATFIEGNTGISMGNYFFTPAGGGNEVKVEYSLGFVRGDDGMMRIFLHHSSLPYSPN